MEDGLLHAFQSLSIQGYTTFECLMDNVLQAGRVMVIVSKKGIQCCQSKMADVQAWPEPDYKEHGLVGYYHQFIPNFIFSPTL